LLWGRYTEEMGATPAGSAAATPGWRQELPLLWTTGCCSWPPGRARAAIKVWE